MQVRAKSPAIWCSRPDLSAVEAAEQQALTAEHAWFQGAGPLRPALVRQQLFFPDRRLLQYDCGKLQVLLLAAQLLKSARHLPTTACSAARAYVQGPG